MSQTHVTATNVLPNSQMYDIMSMKCPVLWVPGLGMDPHASVFTFVYLCSRFVVARDRL